MRRRPFGLESNTPRDRRKTKPCLRLETLEGRQLLTTIIVTNTNDSGLGSFRNALLISNSTTGANVIQFDITGGTGVQTITPLSPLPTITNTVTVDATTEPGTGTTPLIDLIGTSAGAGANGISINLPSGSTPSTIRGLAIGGFAGSGILITGVGGNAVEESIIGLNAGGLAAVPNGDGISIIGSANNTIGGITGTFQNIISGNTTDGVLISGSTSTQNIVEGNTIGLDTTGSTPIANGIGIEIAGASNNTIGGAVPAARNVISGNANPSSVGDTTKIGVSIHDVASAGNVVEGNYIGTNSSGTAAVGNGVGILLANAASSNTVGGSATADRNLISGNQAIQVSLSDSSNNVVENNYVGTNSDGATPIGSTQATTAGILLAGGATTNTIGGVSGGVANIIASSSGPGVEILGNTALPNTTNNIVEGNQIGTNAAGTSPLPNADGVLVTAGTTGNTIGGTGLLARNIISGNTGPGVSISGTATTANVVQANYIGLALDGVTALPNTGDGINVDGASTTTVGGTATGAGNTIADNDEAGVFVNAGIGVDISRNFIFNNIGLGIDLAPRGINTNIATSPGTGPNNLLNYPVLSSVTTANGATTVVGTLHAVPSTAYSLELFSNTSADTSGNGQGRNFVGTASVTTDATGLASFTTTTTQAVTAGSFVTATAIDGSGNTSEYSADVANTAPTADLGIVMFQNPNPAPTGGLVMYSIGVANGGPSPSTGVVITDTLPTGVTFQGALPSAGNVSISGQTVTITLGTLASGATASVVITATLPTTAGNLTNTATVSSGVTDSNSANNTASVITTVVSGVTLSVTGTANPPTATVGSPETLTFTVSNSSTTNYADDITLAIPLPAGVTYSASSSSQGSTAINSNASGVGAALGSLAPGGSAQVVLTLIPTTAGTLSLTATANSDEPNLVPSGSVFVSNVTVNPASTAPVVGTAGPLVTNLTRTGIHNQETDIVVSFSGALTPATASDLRNYSLVKPGANGKFSTSGDVAVPLLSASYNSVFNTVTIVTKKPLAFNQKVELMVRGTPEGGVTNSLGVLLDGTYNNGSGTNFVKFFSGVGPGAVSSSDAVDSVIASGTVKVKSRSHRVQ